MHHTTVSAGRLVMLLLACAITTRAATSVYEIVVDGSQTYQRIEGFGTCLFPHRTNPKYYAREEFPRLYAVEMGLNMLRINISFFPCEPFDNPDDVTWRDIEETKQGAVFTTFIKRVQQINPELRLLATVWTPPAWMKVNQSPHNGGQRNRGILASSYRHAKGGGVSDNRVTPDKYEHFAAWLVAVTAFFASNGMPLYALSPANEVRFSQTYVSCVWTAEDYARMLGILGDRMKKSGCGNVLLFGPEDMTGHVHKEGTPAYLHAVMNHAKARGYLSRFATHGYTDGVIEDVSEASSRALWDVLKPYGLVFWMTEGGTGPHAWPTPVTQGVGVGLHNALVAGNASAWVPWQITGEQPTGHSLMSGCSLTPKSHTVQHFTRTIPVDSRRIAAEPAFGAVLASAYYRAGDGRLGIVLINPGASHRTVRLRLRNVEGSGPLDLYTTTDGTGYTKEGRVTPRKGVLELPLAARSIASLKSAEAGERESGVPTGI